MISRQVVNPSLGFILIISFYHILIFNVESVDLSPDAGQALHGVDDSSRDRISHEINQNYWQKLRVLPKRDAVFSIFQVFAGVVGVVAISFLIVRCIKSLKSVDHKNSSRRLATAAAPCGSGGPAEAVLEGDEYEELVEKIVKLTAKLEAEAGKPDDWEGTTRQYQTMSEQWHQSVIEEATNVIDKARYDTTLTPGQVAEVKGKRRILFEYKILPLLDDANPAMAMVAAERLSKVAERAERIFGIGMGELKSITLKIKQRQAVTLDKNVDYLGPLRDALKRKPQFLYMDYRTYLRDANNMLEVLYMYHKQLLIREEKVRHYMDMMNQSDTELLNKELSDIESSDAESLDLSD